MRNLYALFLMEVTKIEALDVLRMEPTSGHLFLFRSRGGDKLKALHYEDHDFTLYRLGKII